MEAPLADEVLYESLTEPREMLESDSDRLHVLHGGC